MGDRDIAADAEAHHVQWVHLEFVIEELPAGFDALRAEAHAEGCRFVDRLAGDWMSGTVRFDREGEALLAAQVSGELAGIGGLTI